MYCKMFYFHVIEVDRKFYKRWLMFFPKLTRHRELLALQQSIVLFHNSHSFNHK